MTNTYDTSGFLPCPFCGAKPEAMDWHAGPRARIFVDCPNGNYDDEHGGCSVGPQVVGSDMEDAAARWNRRQSQQAQGEPVAFARMLGGEVDWDENCLFPDAETGISDLDGRGDSDEYEIVPLYRHPPVLANMPEQGEHTKPVADAVKHLNDWLSMGLCGCEGPGHSCGATQIRNTIEALEKLLNAPPAPAAVPEFDKKLFDSECRESVAGALGFPRGGDYAWSYLLAQIKEVVEAAGRLPASPAPGHAAEADVCQNCETALPEGCGGIFAHTGTACRYDENQQEEEER